MSKDIEFQREKTLHELNLEQREIDRSIRETNIEAANAAGKATLDVLNRHRPDGKRMQKPVRSPVTE